ncbi:DUF4352 domain-containing protein [Actinoplanes sp. M2I2]|uniref:DUF4352 domain-containing protein n=1 Tax=Actinoplanes sp. M2I2 TaxID=1734444 RepID=UPI00202174E6|nr:DUF4352 domain-containing protein [Actinoplanes sp. M2I2]
MTNTPLRPARSTPVASDPRDPRRGKAPWIAGGVFVLVLAGVGTYLAYRTGEDSAVPVTPTATARDIAVATSDAVPVRDAVPAPAIVTASEGTLEISLSTTKCGVAAVGPADLPLAAEGEFCLVDMAARNTGKEPRLLDPGAQRAVDEHGRSHRVAEQAAVLINDRDPSLLDEIPPGATRHGVVPFDVPKGIRLAAFMLHKSPYSTGVRVPLP